MKEIWDALTYDSERKRLVPCFEGFYGTAAELVARSCPASPEILDLGAGTGILSSVILERVKSSRLHLLDASSEMLGRAESRLKDCQPRILVQPLTHEVLRGPFNAVVSALAIHHLGDGEKRSLYSRVFEVLRPGGIFINAEQVAGSSARLERLFEATHLDRARQLGSSSREIQGALQRMTHDRCATVGEQLGWLEDSGFQDVECFFRWFRFAVFGGWKPEE